MPRARARVIVLGCMRLSIPIAEPRAVLGWGDEHRPSTALAILVETALEGRRRGIPVHPEYFLVLWRVEEWGGC